MEAENKKQSENKESLASVVFFAVFFLAIFLVVSFTFIKYFVSRDYYITAETDCDPEVEKCFIWSCDPASEEEGESCTGDQELDVWYYKIVKKNASQIPFCEPQEECDAISCLAGEDCEETLCDESLLAEGEECSDPEEYLKTLEEESGEEEECESETEECDTTGEDGDEESTETEIETIENEETVGMRL